MTFLNEDPTTRRIHVSIEGNLFVYSSISLHSFQLPISDKFQLDLFPAQLTHEFNHYNAHELPSDGIISIYYIIE